MDIRDQPVEFELLIIPCWADQRTMQLIKHGGDGPDGAPPLRKSSSMASKLAVELKAGLGTKRRAAGAVLPTRRLFILNPHLHTQPCLLMAPKMDRRVIQIGCI